MAQNGLLDSFDSFRAGWQTVGMPGASMNIVKARKPPLLSDSIYYIALNRSMLSNIKSRLFSVGVSVSP